MAGADHQAGLIRMEHGNGTHCSFDQSFPTELTTQSSEVGYDMWGNDNVVKHNRWHRCFFNFLNHFSCSDEASSQTLDFCCKSSDFHFSIGVYRWFFCLLFCCNRFLNQRFLWRIVFFDRLSVSWFRDLFFDD